MTTDEANDLWDRHAFADEDRSTELGDLADLAADLGGTAKPTIVERDEWYNIVDDLHREHSEINETDLLDYIVWVTEERNR